VLVFIGAPQLNVCFVYKEDYPWDVRVEKIINTLLAKGHKVDLVCQNRNQLATHENTGSFHIHRLPRTGSLPKALQALINLALWFNPFWLYAIYKAAKTNQSQLIIIRDLPLMLSGIIVARMLKAKVVFDMAECYPEMYLSIAQHNKTSLADKILKNEKITRAYEKYAVTHCDHIFVMIEESRDRLLAMGVPASNITIVSNTPIVQNAPEPVSHSGDELRIIYVGFVTKLRGIDLLVSAIHQFVNSPEGGKKIRLDVIGKGEARAHLEQMIDHLHLHDHVTIHGWLEHEEAQKIMNAANAGALTYRFCSHWNNTIPNKIFDYMLKGLPVIATNVIPIGRILTSNHCGLTSDDKDISSIFRLLVKLKNPALRQELGCYGNKAVIEKYNWSIDSQNLEKALADLQLQL
jgi:glycosyltransferase involved in cell wall biosynthesis